MTLPPIWRYSNAARTAAGVGDRAGHVNGVGLEGERGIAGGGRTDRRFAVARDAAAVAGVASQRSNRQVVVTEHNGPVEDWALLLTF